MRRLVPESRTERTTILLPEVINVNLDLFCLATRRSKGEVVREAVTDYLKAQRMNPLVMPKIKLPLAARVSKKQ